MKQSNATPIHFTLLISTFIFALLIGCTGNGTTNQPSETEETNQPQTTKASSAKTSEPQTFSNKDKLWLELEKVLQPYSGITLGNEVIKDLESYTTSKDGVSTTYYRVQLWMNSDPAANTPRLGRDISAPILTSTDDGIVIIETVYHESLGEVWVYEIGNSKLEPLDSVNGNFVKFKDHGFVVHNNPFFPDFGESDVQDLMYTINRDKYNDLYQLLCYKTMIVENGKLASITYSTSDENRKNTLIKELESEVVAYNPAASNEIAVRTKALRIFNSLSDGSTGHDIRIVKASTLNLRANPDLSSSSVAKMMDSERVEVIDKTCHRSNIVVDGVSIKGCFLKVERANGQVGYAFDHYLEVLEF